MTSMRSALRISESCPTCAAPLVLVAEEHAQHGENRVACSRCNFSERYDRRAAALLDRLLFLQRELLKRDPQAELWEEAS